MIFFLKIGEILLTAVIADRGGGVKNFGKHVNIILEHSLINLPFEGIAKGVEKKPGLKITLMKLFLRLQTLYRVFQKE